MRARTWRSEAMRRQRTVRQASRALVVGVCAAIGVAVGASQATAQIRMGGPAEPGGTGPGGSAYRPDGQLGVCGHRGLDLPDAHPGARRLHERTGERRRCRRRRRLGSGGRQRGRPAVQGIRCRAHHAHADAAANRLGRRLHAADRGRQRNPDPSDPLLGPGAPVAHEHDARRHIRGDGAGRATRWPTGRTR